MYNYKKNKFDFECVLLKNMSMNKFKVMIKLSLRRFNRLSVSSRVAVFLISSILIFILLTTLLPSVCTIIRNSSFLETDKCPACYGFKACDKLKNGEITLTSASNFMSFFGNLEKYNGITDEGSTVILKKFGSHAQIEEWENLICTLAKKPQKCDVASAAQMIFPLSGSKWILNRVKGQSMMTMCPSERLVNTMQFRYTETLDAIDMSAKERTQMVLTLWKSQEPIIYQMFKQQDGWPFPEYLGSCGRVMIYEDPGEPLHAFLNEPWTLRIELAIKLLKIAHKLTHNLSKYGMYMLSVNFKSFHVNRNTKNVYYTRPDDLLVVDRWQIEQEKIPGWDIPFIRNFSQCAVSNPLLSMNCKHQEDWGNFNDFCKRHFSDHNFYAICRNILSPVTNTEYSHPERVGLLNNIPEDINILYGIDKLIYKCAEIPSGEDREEVATQLLASLERILHKD